MADRTYDAGSCEINTVGTNIRRNEIGWAIKQMWAGQAMQRRGWNGRGMYIKLQIPDTNSKMSAPYVYMKTADGHLVPWLASQTDLLATDWDFYQEV